MRVLFPALVIVGVLTLALLAQGLLDSAIGAWVAIVTVFVYVGLALFGFLPGSPFDGDGS